MKWSKLYNPLMIGLLRSPLHGIVSGMYMVVGFTGRKTGRPYRTPVEYCFDGDTLLFFTARERGWWRNLRDGAQVTVRLRGSDRSGTAQTSLGDAEAFRQAFEAYLRRYPGREKYFNIRRRADDALNPDDLAAAAERTVVVRIALA